MSGEQKPRSVLSELKRPLMQPPAHVPAALEERLLGTGGAAPAAVPEPPAAPARKAKVPTVPVTFHLPVELRDRIKVTAQAKQMTMLEIATAALEQYLEKNPVSEADLRRLLGL